MLPRAGDVLRIGPLASVQFAKPISFRVIRVHDWPTYMGWVWLDGYELAVSGVDAMARRSIFVQIAGLAPAGRTPERRGRNDRVPGVTRQREVTR